MTLIQPLERHESGANPHKNKKNLLLKGMGAIKSVFWTKGKKGG